MQRWLGKEEFRRSGRRRTTAKRVYAAEISLADGKEKLKKLFACIGSDRRKVNLINGDTPRVAQPFIAMTSCIMQHNVERASKREWERENVQVDKNLGWIGIHNQAGKASYISRLFCPGVRWTRGESSKRREIPESIPWKSLDTITHKKSWIKNNEKSAAMC